MKKLFLFILLLPAFVFAADNNYYHTKINGADVFIFSIKDNLMNTKIITTDDINAINYNKQVNPKGALKVCHNIMVIKKDGKNILIDTGFPDTINSLEKALNKAGLKFADITHIILTHAHYDHAGGLINNNKKIFPNAALYIHQKEYNYWVHENKSKSNNIKNILSAYKNNIKFYTSNKIDKDIDFINIINAFGHTPGHSLINIKDKNTNLIFVADLFHVYNVQIKYPQAAVIFDVDKKMAVKARQDFIKKYKGTNTLIVGAHTPFYKPVVWK